VFFDELGIPAPERQLGLGNGSNTEQTARMLAALEGEVRAAAPDVVLVYGDTNSTLAGALAGAQARRPVAHVEAGMRSFDRAMPEELNRVLTDHAAELLFCSTETAVENLEREGVHGATHLVGDVMADVALSFVGVAERDAPRVLDEHGVSDGDYVLVTAHRPGNVDEPSRLERLVELLEALPLAAVLPLHPRTRLRLADSGLLDRLESAPHIRLTPPLGYLAFLALTGHARAVLTDSGGVQKEAYLLGTPCVTLRDRTEWAETVENGWNTLVDLDREGALRALERGPPPGGRPELYGGGRAGERIRDLLASYTDGR
jgi:UDP-GlcNAc3NAcA epimerase